MTAANALNIPSIGPISNTATGTFSSSYNKFYQPGYSNVGIAFSGTTLTVQSESGTAMSSTNPGFIALQSLATPGQIVRYSVTANQTFTKAGLGNSLFGLTTAIDITVDIPFYLYAVSNANNGENTIAFMISRIPHRTIAPLATKIGQSGNTLASTQGSFYSLATITASDYASSPCLCIGSFRMQYISSLWTIQTLNNADGIGEYNEQTKFTFPNGQYGSAAGTWFTNNGGTAPIPTGGSGYAYQIFKSGQCSLKTAWAPGGSAGIGAVVLTLVLPGQSTDGGTIGSGYFLDGGAYSVLTVLAPSSLPSSFTTGMAFSNPVTSGLLQNVNMSNTASLGINSIYGLSLA